MVNEVSETCFLFDAVTMFSNSHEYFDPNTAFGCPKMANELNFGSQLCDIWSQQGSMDQARHMWKLNCELYDVAWRDD